MVAGNNQAALQSGALTCGFRIAGTSLELLGRSEEDLHFSPGLEMFRSSEWVPDITVEVEWTGMLRPHFGTPVFESGSAWSVSKDERDFVFDFSSSVLSSNPYKRLHVNPDFTRARLLLSRAALDSHRPILPLEYPADELLITNYLAVHSFGVEVHGCGLIDSETGGHLFLGHSGAGKSTTARLWETFRNPEILSDDRIILRIENGELWMHGTPWHGEGQFASPGKARVNNIFILQHGHGNERVELTPSRAAGELFARAFPPFHSSIGLERTVEFLGRVVAIAPCFEFSFAPDASSVNSVLEFTHVAAAC